jgi:hypothetical protein
MCGLVSSMLRTRGYIRGQVQEAGPGGLSINKVTFRPWLTLREDTVLTFNIHVVKSLIRRQC